MTIGQFLIKLACDERFLRLFTDNPEEAMREAELDERHIQFLLTADLSTLRLKVESEFEIGDDKVAIITIFTIPTIFSPHTPTEET